MGGNRVNQRGHSVAKLTKSRWAGVHILTLRAVGQSDGKVKSNGNKYIKTTDYCDEYVLEQ